MIDASTMNGTWFVGDYAAVVHPGLTYCKHGAKFNGGACPPQHEVVMVSGMYWRKCGCFVLEFSGGTSALATRCRKVRPVSIEESEVVSHILKAKPGKDNVREDA